MSLEACTAIVRGGLLKSWRKATLDQVANAMDDCDFGAVMGECMAELTESLTRIMGIQVEEEPEKN